MSDNSNKKDPTSTIKTSSGLEIPLSSLDSRLRNLGQRPTQPPTVDGWPEGTLWLSAQAMLERTNLVYDSIAGPSAAEFAALLPAPDATAEETLVDAGAKHIAISNIGPALTGASPRDMLRMASLIRKLRRL